MALLISDESYVKLNFMILPIVGILSYLRQKQQFWKTLLVILAMDAAGYWITLGLASMRGSVYYMTAYALLFLVGVAIAALLQFAFSKEGR